jgi:hypothetical protein
MLIADSLKDRADRHHGARTRQNAHLSRRQLCKIAAATVSPFKVGTSALTGISPSRSGNFSPGKGNQVWRAFASGR